MKAAELRLLFYNSCSCAKIPELTIAEIEKIRASLKDLYNNSNLF